jgi:MFS family permease
MKLGFLTKDLAISSKRFLAVTFLISGTLAWFFLLNAYLGDILTSITQDSFLVAFGQFLFYAFGVISAIAGSLICRKINRRKMLSLWIAFGAISTVLLSIFQGTIFSLISSILLGLSLGLGLPSSMAFLAESTVVAERGRVAGITILGTFVMAFLAGAVITFLGSGIVTAIILCTIVRSTSVLALVFDKCDRKEEKEHFWLSKPNYKELIFYLLPWIMFIVAAGFASNMIDVPGTEYLSAISTGQVLRYATIALFSIVWGVTADRIGRKQPIIIGLIILGSSFALLGFAMVPLSVLIYLAMSGIAWGSFFTIYLIIPGDLSIPSSREKFYALGTISPFIIFMGLSISPISSIFTIISVSAFSQILSLLLFLSIAPVSRAKETLLEFQKYERKMKEHVNKVSKIIQESEKSE